MRPDMDEKIPKIPTREITEPATYLNRRTFMRAGILAATVAATGGAYRAFFSPRRRPVTAAKGASTLPTSRAAFPTVGPSSIAEMHAITEPQTTFDDITHYNNFYEFSTDKAEVADAAAGFITRPWT